ncbi:hypothetical protein BKA62DRAFT_297409 [Auriculariales sp. MPI-PUGE-AT-0066]|nr:hypothetical protein BKA62DRAFT_297409 [Auriculariales sp. MPI-PUGE-AT-0066]
MAAPPTITVAKDAAGSEQLDVERDEAKASSEFGYIPSEAPASEVGLTSHEDAVPVVSSYATVEGSTALPADPPALTPIVDKLAEEKLAAANTVPAALPAVVDESTPPPSVSPAPTHPVQQSKADVAPETYNLVLNGNGNVQESVTPPVPTRALSAAEARAIQDASELKAVPDAAASTTAAQEPVTTSGDQFNTLNVEEYTKSAARPRLTLTAEDGTTAEHNDHDHDHHSIRDRLASTTSRHLPGAWRDHMGTPGETYAVHAPGEISSPTTPKHKRKQSCIIS